ncbi:GH3 auxin-responsive promoter family protein [Flavobacteriaceae bacterium]|uniref:GH3 auxin-responsive promoter family protein n=1 Tax=Candidatus Arcticimaribacter forsetii TaxID=2820661 RepID=UPI0020773D11|nr:GH3 auxin-responsive promoter family protein [Candidatus Arcticimaribacter forsetii]MDA8698632.1 GH3 auxin-responsive promoter family protein [Flavobacteriaceae bacterium]MDB2325883.1 GH3 auxin-responsive promoter family protein [Flavobacteriaceae bacterium]MDB2329894.1 GH3 auxin-responsive promoter family protein [Flavobacteriaceae bacterium]MDB4673931.1 GH3 auxin-responsive promoter family protein [Flavobacteriaceae bacterium]MDB4716631.1 GH3 auxin-responsive promoter family protein [Flav
MKKTLAKLFARIRVNRNKKWVNNPVEAQQKTFQKLIKSGSKTLFGADHKFQEIKNPSDFAKNVPVRDYEGLRSYIEKTVEGEEDILWPGKPIYFSKTSGTTSGAKYIPITKESMPTHINAALDALLTYINYTGKADFVLGKQIFIQGSPELDQKNGISLGRLSGIVAHYVPSYLRKSRMPSWETNCIEDWEEKVNAIVEETLPEKMTLIAGIPSWVQMYFEKIKNKTNKDVGDVFKNFSLFVYGGVNFEPYKSVFKNLIGRTVDSIELFPASEGFFAYQDVPNQEGLLLLLNNDIFYEFIRVDEIQQENPKRHTIGEVELGVNYALILSTSAGLWGYNIGDTVKFVSTAPYRLVVTGRIKHFISAFGEHVIGKEVETALKNATEGTSIRVREFTVAPQVKPEKGLPYHEWCIEFDKAPDDIEAFEIRLDSEMEKQNVYYQDLIQGNILRKLVIKPIERKGFEAYMKGIGKLGGQNKVPRLANDRKIADALIRAK